jgi:hypothetical protein
MRNSSASLEETGMDKNGASLLGELKIRGGDLVVVYKTDKVEELKIDASQIDIKHETILFFKDQNQEEVYIDIAAVISIRFAARAPQPGIRPTQPAPARPARGFER